MKLNIGDGHCDDYVSDYASDNGGTASLQARIVNYIPQHYNLQYLIDLFIFKEIDTTYHYIFETSL